MTSNGTKKANFKPEFKSAARTYKTSIKHKIKLIPIHKTNYIFQKISLILILFHRILHQKS